MLLLQTYASFKNESFVDIHENCPNVSFRIYFGKTDLNEIKVVAISKILRSFVNLRTATVGVVIYDSPSVCRGKKNSLPINGFS